MGNASTSVARTSKFRSLGQWLNGCQRRGSSNVMRSSYLKLEEWREALSLCRDWHAEDAIDASLLTGSTEPAVWTFIHLQLLLKLAPSQRIQLEISSDVANGLALRMGYGFYWGIPGMVTGTGKESTTSPPCVPHSGLGASLVRSLRNGVCNLPCQPNSRFVTDATDHVVWVAVRPSDAWVLCQVNIKAYCRCVPR